MKKIGISFMAGMVATAMALTGCAKQPETSNQQAEPASTTDTKYTDSEESNEKRILVVSFGTSYNDSRDITIGAIEKAIENAFPEYDVRRAFTSQIIIDILAKRQGLIIDNVEQALDRAAADGVKTLIVQPTHLMNGYEYTDLVKALEQYHDRFDKIALGAPLLTSDDDFNKVIDSVSTETIDYYNKETAICFMGHGTEADANSVYAKLQQMLTANGKGSYFVGTVQADPTIEDVLEKVKAGGFKKVVLAPLMIVAGDHANNDMAGDEEDSWKKQFESAGYEVECVLRGLGEYKGIQDIFVEHIREAMNSLNEI